MGWSWSIARARASGEPDAVTPATRQHRERLDRRLRALGRLSHRRRADGAAAVRRAARAASLSVRIQQPGTPITPILADTLPPGTVATFSSGAAAESTSTFVAPQQPGIWILALKVGNAIKPLGGFQRHHAAGPRPRSESGRLGLYYIGNWPAARKGRPGVSYDPPSGFIEVTPQNQNTQLSEHFKLKDFLPHDQQNVWPKYIVVDMKMIDKDELVLAGSEGARHQSSGRPRHERLPDSPIQRRRW